MTATKTVTRLPLRTSADKHLRRDPQAVHFQRVFARDHGVVVLVGYGIQVRVERGHLILEDGIGSDRRLGRFPRVHHELRRVVVIGADGMVSLAALRWLADQNISFVMLERDGSVLVSTGPVSASDTRLRRAQACAVHSDAAIDIVRELINLKLSGQEAIVREKLRDLRAADFIARFRQQLGSAESIDAVRVIEANAASAYWIAWQKLEVRFPKSDLPRVPDHWRRFDNRRSPISGTSRRAPNPVNAILNYLYTLLESETRLAIMALGLDPGFGLLHVDQSTRDSLVYDLMEPVRPKIDAYVLDWVARTPLKRSWFFEERDGCCRLMADLTVHLTETAQTWSREVAPLVEWFAQTIAATAINNDRIRAPGTRLTQRRRYEGQGGNLPAVEKAPVQQSVCRNCGAAVSLGGMYCNSCSLKEGGKRISEASKAGRLAALAPQNRAKVSKKIREHRDAIRNWDSSKLPDWLDDNFYAAKIQPMIKKLSKIAVARELGVTDSYVYEIARGEKLPHRRHWLKLAELVGAR